MGTAREIGRLTAEGMGEYASTQGRALKKSGKWFLLAVLALAGGAALGAIGAPVAAGACGVLVLVFTLVGIWKFGSAGGDVSAGAASDN